MTSAIEQVTAELAVRPYRAADAVEVIELIDADRIQGQPACSMRMLDEALAGRSTIDAGWWEELDPPRTDVLVAPGGQVVAVISYASRRTDRAGIVLWLHGREDPFLVEHLLAYALTKLKGSLALHAFQFASALGFGLEGLPVRHRPVTDKALRNSGFVSSDLWRYMYRELRTVPESPPPRSLRWRQARTGRDGGWRCGRRPVS